MTKDEHLQTIAMEECNELAQRVSKALRFGMEQVQPGQSLNNRERIIEEYAHVQAAMEMIGITSVPRELVDMKRAKVEKFMRYSEKLCGTVESAKSVENASVSGVTGTAPPQDSK